MPARIPRVPPGLQGHVFKPRKVSKTTKTAEAKAKKAPVRGRRGYLANLREVLPLEIICEVRPMRNQRQRRPNSRTPDFELPAALGPDPPGMDIKGLPQSRDEQNFRLRVEGRAPVSPRFSRLPCGYERTALRSSRLCSRVSCTVPLQLLTLIGISYSRLAH